MYNYTFLNKKLSELSPHGENSAEDCTIEKNVYLKCLAIILTIAGLRILIIWVQTIYITIRCEKYHNDTILPSAINCKLWHSLQE